MNDDSFPRARFPRTTAAQRRRWVKRFRGANLSQRDFAARHGMSLSALVRWIAENPSDGRNADLQWQEISMNGIHSQAPWAAELAFKDGCTLRLSAQAAAALLEPWLLARR